MLHIMLLILKIIGIIVLAVLGIIVLLACVVLFVPVKYKVSAQCDGTLQGLKANFTCTWLLRILGVRMVYKEQSFQWEWRVLWLRGPKEEQEVSIKKDKENLKENQTEKKEVNEYEKGCNEAVEEEKETVRESNQITKISEKIAEQEAKTEQKQDEKSSQDEAKGNSKSVTQIKKMFEKCREIGKKIKYTFRSFCDRINLLIRKKETVMEFLNDEIHRAAFVKVKVLLFRLVKRLKPKRFRANVHYGFEDPCTTGQVLAGLSVLYPFIGEHAVIVPDFENQVLDGALYVYGKLRGIHFLAFACKLLLSRAVRSTYKDIRSLKV